MTVLNSALHFRRYQGLSPAYSPIEFTNQENIDFTYICS